MEFLDKLVLPHSSEHLRLLIYVLALALIIFLPYAGILMGSSLYSILLNVWGRKKNDINATRLSRELIGLVTARKSFALIFGILPLFTVIVTYSQLLHQTNMSIASYLLTALVIFTLGVISIYVYKYTFYIDDIFKIRGGNISPDDDVVKVDRKEEFTSFMHGNLKAHKIAAALGVILIFLSAFMVITGVQLSFDRSNWREGTSFLKLLFSYSPVVKFFYFMIASFAITSIGVLYYYFRIDKEKTSENKVYSEYVLKYSLYTGMVLSVLLPIFVIINLLSIPGYALSNTLFGINLLILVLLFLLAHYLYTMIKQSHTRYGSISFVILTAVFVLFVVNDQVAFNTTSQSHRIVLASEYNQISARLSEATQVSEVNGEEIYNRLCVSCHRFDQQIVGPAYNTVLGKYEGNMEQLTKFIADPVKVDPKFPPMPDLGLRTNEAKAAAEYLLKTYKK